MLDSQIVAAIVAGDPDGLAAAYDRYAAPLCAFCQSLLNDQDDAADIVQETFIIASAKLDRLRDPDLLKPWLFAVARNECHQLLRARPGGVAGVEAHEVSDDTIDFGIDLERAALAEVAAASMAALPLATREAVELSLREDFDSGDLASTLGISPNHAQVLASRARGQFRKSAAALLAVRAGARQYCDKLDEMLDSQDDRLTAAASQEIVRHVQRCRTCSRRRPRELRPETLLRGLSTAEIVRGLRQQVLGVAASDAPDVIAYRADVVSRVTPFDEDSGFPVPVDRPRRERRVRPAVLALGATAVLATLGAVGLELGLHHSHAQPKLAAAPVSQPSSHAQAATSPAQAAGQRTPSPASPGWLAAATPGITPSPSSPLLVPPPGIIRPLGSRPPSTPPPISPSTPPTTPVTTPPTTPATSPPTTPVTTPPTTPATTPPTTPPTTPATTPPTTPAAAPAPLP